MLGSNPIACSAPAEPYPFFFDASTTVVTRGKLEMYNKMNKPIPTGWAVNKEGQSSNSASEVLGNIKAHEGGGIVPLGGDTEQLGGHKGYGYGMLCELFSSILSQGMTSAHTMQMVTQEFVMDLWQSTLLSLAIQMKLKLISVNI